MERRRLFAVQLLLALAALLLVGEALLPDRAFLPLLPDDFLTWQIGAEPDMLARHPHPNWTMSDVGLLVTRDAALEGRLPLWDPSQALGVPHLAQVHYGVLYPPAWIPLALGTKGLALLAWLHLILAGGGMAAWLGVVGRSRLACFVGGMAFMGSAWVTARLHAFPVVGALVWLPWILWALEHAAARDSWRHRALAAVFTALSWLAGFPQIAAWVLVLAAVFELLRALAARRHGRPALRPLLGNGLALGLGLVLALPQLLPTLEYLGAESARTGQSAEATGAMALEPPLLWHLIAPDRYAAADVPGLNPLALEVLEGARLPGALSRPEVSLSIGVLGLLLALLAMIFGRTWRSRTLTGLTLVLLLLVFWPAALTAAARLFPPLRFGNPSRLLALTSFTLAALTAGGLDLVKSHRMRATVTAWGLAVALTVLAVTARLGVTAVADDYEVETWATHLKVGLGQSELPLEDFLALVPRENFRAASATASTSCLIALLAGVAAVILFRPRRASTVEGWKTLARSAPWLVALVLTAELMLQARPLLRAAPTRGVITEPFSLDPLPVPELAREARTAAGDGPVPARVARLGATATWLRLNLAGMFGLADLQAYAPMAPRRVVELLQALDPELQSSGSAILGFTSALPLTLPAVDLMGIAVLLSGQPDTPEGFGETAVLPPVRILRNRQALPRAFAVPLSGALVVADPAERLELLSEPDFDPKTMVLLASDTGLVPDATEFQRRREADAMREAAGLPAVLEDPAPAGRGAPGSGRRPARMVDYAPGYLRLELGPGEPVLVVFTETWHSGWRARVDVDEAPVLQADHAFMAVPVHGADAAVVQFVYEPAEVRWGLRLGGAGLVVVLLLLVWPRRRRR